MKIMTIDVLHSSESIVKLSTEELGQLATKWHYIGTGMKSLDRAYMNPAIKCGIAIMYINDITTDGWILDVTVHDKQTHAQLSNKPLGISTEMVQDESFARAISAVYILAKQMECIG
jgi:hypothetical protein